MTVHRLSSPVTAALIGFLLLFASFAARADALQEASRALKQGQHTMALEQVERYLATKPKDAQGRFLKGIILTEMNRNGEAIAVFTRLTEDYPELPEPYNNLAVIYAQQKQYDKAKQALEMAIRTHPSYATAHENLGDLYARLASQAYDKALQLDSSNAGAQSKLALIRELMSSDTKVAMRPSKVEPTVPATKPITPPPPTVVATATPPKTPEVAKPEPKPEPKPEVKPEPKPEPKVEPKPEVKPDAAKPTDVQTEVVKTLEAWAAAWSRKDVKGYLARYAKDFKTPNGESRADWETERNNRINKPGKISVSIENIKVTADNSEQVTARFRQHYKSASLSSSGNKTMVLVKREGKWLIQQERIGS